MGSSIKNSKHDLCYTFFPSKKAVLASIYSSYSISDIHFGHSNRTLYQIWVCRSDGDPKCADPFDNTSFPITDCRQVEERAHLQGLEATMCRKVRQKVNGEWRYIRSCAFLGEPGLESSIGSGRDERYCIHRTGTYNIHVEYCTCRSKDGCNSGRRFAPTNWMILSVLSIVIVTIVQQSHFISIS